MPAIIGHESALETIRGTLSSGRIHHAWIISGPVGIGKRTLACEFARVLLDPQASSDDLGLGGTALMSSEGQLLDAGTHPDLYLIRKEDAEHSDSKTLNRRKQMNIPLDLLRERLLGGCTADSTKKHESPAYHTSKLGQGKVFIIDEAELIDLYGQNALLKTLEEPPPKTWLFLITSRPERLLPTVRSRCEHLRLGPLSDEDMRQWLTDELPDTPDVEWMLQWAEGGPGMAVLADETSLLDCARDLEPILRDLDEGRWKTTFGGTVNDFIAGWADKVVKANPRASKDLANKMGASLVLRMLAKRVRTQLETVTPGDLETGRRLWDLANRVSEAEDNLQRGLNMKHAMESLGAGWSERCRA
ncbi:MAG: hypothetical protein MK116_13755 [Phycisphaerales bacterium]|nr:hypothetical protein [Phycisphaerales bacterium]